jgi:hypothetical protein
MMSRNRRVPLADDNSLMLSSRGRGGHGRSHGKVYYSDIILTNRWIHIAVVSRQKRKKKELQDIPRGGGR